MMTIDEAIRSLRNDERYADLVRDAYLDRNVGDSAERFYRSGEFSEVLRLFGNDLAGKVILDLGAGTGIASHAFARQRAKRVYAVEPDTSDEVGQGAIRRLPCGLPISVIGAIGEALPLGDQCVDIIYTRQVLHHTRDLSRVLRECHRVLKPGGTFLACREHVVDDATQLAVFLAAHPVHQLAGGENAYSLAEYVNAIQSSGMKLAKVIDPWESIINYFPGVRSQTELKTLPRAFLEAKFGRFGNALGQLPGVSNLVWKRIRQPYPGRMYSFLATKLQ
jgi:ubiquinone/menaquinone biosynthesis C-methylase UbiE